jgi:hypothetical protein
MLAEFGKSSAHLYQQVDAKLHIRDSGKGTATSQVFATTRGTILQKVVENGETQLVSRLLEAPPST